MRSLYDFIIKPLGDIYKNEVQVGDKSLVVNTKIESWKCVNRFYLAWVDCESVQIENPVQAAEDAGLFLSDGKFFGRDRCVRINFGTQTKRLESALSTFSDAMGL